MNVFFRNGLCQAKAPAEVATAQLMVAATAGEISFGSTRMQVLAVR